MLVFISLSQKHFKAGHLSVCHKSHAKLVNTEKHEQKHACVRMYLFV